MSFFNELKRRNVFKVAIAYTVASWLSLQMVDLVLENINAPDWIMQVFMLGLAVGLPIAIVIAWAFELTPEGIKLEKHVDRSKSINRHTGHQLNRGIIMILSMAIVLLLTDRFRDEIFGVPEPGDVKTESTDITADDPVTVEPEKSIAVLPFVDMSPDGDQAYFADGISEEILNVLVKTHSLKVAGRTSSFQFRGRSEDLRTIGDKLGVEHILEGSVRKASNRIRITAQLVKASDGFHLWSETYDRELTDIFAIQDEIARSITDALAIELNLSDTSQSLATASTKNLESYDRYLEARGLITQRLDFPRAIELLDEAVLLDPDFAAGWAANAQAHSLAIYYLNTDIEETNSKAEAMALKALELDPNLSMAHSVLGDIYRDNYQWEASQESYLRALSLNPDEIEANEQYAQMLWRVSYTDEALKYSARAIDLDPLSWINLTVDASLRYASGDHAGGWSDIQRALKMDKGGAPKDFTLRHAIHMAISQGEIERAIELTKLLSLTDWSQENGAKGKAYLDLLIPNLKSREDTLAFLTAKLEEPMLTERDSTWATDLFWAAHYGDYELAGQMMEQGTLLEEQLGIIDTTWFNYPIISPLHNSKPYKDMVRRMKLDDFWRKNGFPINCRPIGEDDFACN